MGLELATVLHFSSYSLVHECACACIPCTNVHAHANVLSLTACSVDEGSVLGNFPTRNLYFQGASNPKEKNGIS